MSTPKEEPAKLDWLIDTFALKAKPSELVVSGTKLSPTLDALDLAKANATKIIDAPVKTLPTITWNTQVAIVYGTKLSGTQLKATVEPAEAKPITFTPAADTLLNAGTHILKAATQETAHYLAAETTVQLIVQKALPKITWEKPDDITYGTKLSGIQLGAEVDPTEAGPITYTPAADTVLNAGTHILKAATQETANYLAAETTVQLVVQKALPTITWAKKPDDITYGTKLSGIRLGAEVDPKEAGPITYTPAAATLLDAGTHILKAATQETANYLAAAGTVQLVVQKALPTITWAKKPDDITYGTKLSGIQLGAEVDPKAAGPITYTPAAETLLNAGTQTIKAETKESANYLATEATVSISVIKAAPVITWNKPPDMDFVAGAVLGSAQLNAGVEPADAGPLIYDPPPGARLTAGLQNLKVSTAASPNYETVEKQVGLQINKVKPLIVWDQPDDTEYVNGGVELTDQQLNAAVIPAEAGPLTYDPAKGKKLSVDDDGLSVKEHKLAATAKTSTNYEESKKEVILKVYKGKPTITWNNPAAVTYVDGGFALTATQLNASADPNIELVYDPLKDTKLNAGTHTLKVKPKDTANYVADLDANVSIIVKKAAPEITWNEPVAVVANKAGNTKFELTGTQLNATRVKGESALVYTPASGQTVTVGTHQITVKHAESANYGYLEKSVRLMVHASANLQNGYESARHGGGWQNPALLNTQIMPDGNSVQHNWNNDVGNVKTEARELMNALQDMTGDELKSYMDIKVPNLTDQHKQPGKYPNQIWKLPNGLQVRLKPKGDKHTNPSASSGLQYQMFCIEVRTTPGFSANQNDIATKITSDGELAPKGPGDTATVGVGSAATDYKTGTCNATHLKCRASKIAQIIECANAITIKYDGKALTKEALNVRLQPGDGAVSFVPAGPLAVGDNQAVTITAAATDRYAVATKAVTVKVEKGRPVIKWKDPGDMVYVDGGAVLADLQLNASVEPVDAGPLTYNPAKDAKLESGVHKLTATTASPHFESVTKEVTVRVAKAAPAITWNTPGALEYVDGGVKLDDSVLNATVNPGTEKLIYAPPLATKLGAGTHVLQVRTEGSKNYKITTAQVNLTIDKAKPVIEWKKPDDITAGDALSAKQLCAVIKSGIGTLVYDPPLSTVLAVGDDQVLTVTLAASDNFGAGSQSVRINVKPKAF